MKKRIISIILTMTLLVSAVVSNTMAAPSNGKITDAISAETFENALLEFPGLITNAADSTVDYVSNIGTGHMQGICVDDYADYMYVSYTDGIGKIDMETGKVTGILNISGLTGYNHIGCLAYYDGYIYGSLEARDVMKYYVIRIAESDFYGVLDTQEEWDEYVRVMLLYEPVQDSRDKMGDDSIDGAGRRFSASAVDGITFGTYPGEFDNEEAAMYMMVSYGAKWYGTDDSTEAVTEQNYRLDDEHLVIQCYNASDFENEDKLMKLAYGTGDGDATGLTDISVQDFDVDVALMAEKTLYVFTGNCQYGPQNLEYDKTTGDIWIATYGAKDGSPVKSSATWFCIDGSKSPQNIEIQVGQNADYTSDTTVIYGSAADRSAEDKQTIEEYAKKRAKWYNLKSVIEFNSDEDTTNDVSWLALGTDYINKVNSDDDETNDVEWNMLGTESMSAYASPTLKFNDEGNLLGDVPYLKCVCSENCAVADYPYIGYKNVLLCGITKNLSEGIASLGHNFYYAACNSKPVGLYYMDWSTKAFTQVTDSNLGTYLESEGLDALEANSLYTILATRISAAEENYTTDDKERFTTDSWTSYQQALTSAKGMTESSGVTELTEAIANLRQGIKGLRIVNTTYDEAIAQVATLEEADYTKVSWANLQAVLSELGEEPTDVERVYDAESLKTAIDSLVKIDGADILDLSIDVDNQTASNAASGGQSIFLRSNKGTITYEYNSSIGMNVAKIRDEAYIKFDLATDSKDYTSNLADGFTFETYYAAYYDETATEVSPWGSLRGGGLGAYLNSATAGTFYVQVCGDSDSLMCNITVPSGEFVHLVLSYDGNVCNLYVDGELKKTTTIGSLKWYSVDDEILYLGADIDYSDTSEKHMDTDVAIARIYDTALTAGQVSALYGEVNTFYDVTFDSCGGSDVDSQTILIGGTVVEPEAPTREKYTFEGWYTDETYSTAWDFATDVVTSATALYAKWEKILLSEAEILDISFDTDSQTAENIAHDELPIVLSTNSNKGTITYEFNKNIGMNVAKIRDDGYIGFDFKDVSGGNYDYTERLTDGYTVEAYFAVNYVEDADGNKVLPEGRVMEMGDNSGGFRVYRYDETRLICQIMNSGSDTINHLFTPADGTYVHFVLVRSNSGVWLYLNGICVAFSESYGTVQWGNEWARVIRFGTDVWGSKPVDVDVALARVYDSALTSTKVASLYSDATTLYTVAFDSCGGSEVASQMMLTGAKVTKPSMPTKGSYTFEGWYTDASYSEMWDFESDMVSSDVTLYAKWSKNGIAGATILDLSIDSVNQEVANISADEQPIALSTDKSVGSIECAYDTGIGMNVAKIRDDGYIKFDYATTAKDYTTNLQDGFTMEAYLSAEWEGSQPTGVPLCSWIQGGFGLKKSSSLTNGWYMQFTTEETTDDETILHTYYYPVSATSGEYVHIVLSYDGTNCSVYVNGTLVKTEITKGTLCWRYDSEKVLFCGADINYSDVTKNHIDTNIAIARIYDTALSANNVKTLYDDVQSRKMLSANVQDDSATTEDQTKLDMRFIGSIDAPDNYQNAGFVFSLKDTNPLPGATGCATRYTNKLYSTILADSEEKSTSDLYGTASSYMFAFEITNIPIGTTIHIRPFVTTADGGVLYGEVRTVEVVGSVEGILLTTPASSATVTVVSDVVDTWMESYNSETNYMSTSMLTGTDVYYSGVKVSWFDSEEADSYTITYGTDADFTDALTKTVSGTTAYLGNLYVDETYYWKVTGTYGDATTVDSASGSFYIKESPRVVYIDGVSNTRDIGGLTNKDGKKLIQGKIYRGGRLEAITDTGKTTALSELGIKTDLDLRGDSDSPTNALGLGESNYINISCCYYTDIMNSDNYSTIGNILKTFASEDNYPIYMHCSAGRDRTGTIGLLLDGLLGVNKEQIFMNYDLSYFSERGSDGGSETMETNRAQFKTLYEAICDYDSSGDFYSNVEKLVLDMGLTSDEVAQIRAIMLEEGN